MKYYCMMVRTGEEERFKQSALEELRGGFPQFSAYVFRKKMRTNKGLFFEQTMFPGYIFCGLPRLEAEVVSRLKALRGFCRFLMSNTDIRPLAGESLSVFENFLRCGESLGLSRLKFEPGRRIVVIDGPLKGLEGNVIAVNKRQRRVTVRLDMMGCVSKVDMCYEDVTEAEDGKE
ncbi:MAG: hypothetical protein K2H09_08940 [Treponemataceae bacterium]|nr:hypothetical protein [Treponemataceae bacterium]